MKKDLGSVLALYPTPLTVVGAVVNGKPNWVLAVSYTHLDVYKRQQYNI